VTAWKTPFANEGEDEGELGERKVVSGLWSNLLVDALAVSVCATGQGLASRGEAL